MKNGIVAGAIAGFLAGVASYLLITALVITTGSSYYPRLVIVEIGLPIIWGVVVSILYVKFHSAIPGKGLLKAVYFSMMIWLFTGVFPFAFLIYRLMINTAILYVATDFVARSVYGIVLGIIYEKRSLR